MRAEAVVLVHGLWLSGHSFMIQARRLRRCGYAVHAVSYRSVRDGLYANAARLDGFVRGLETERVHFVGHSLGGILIRALFHYFPAQSPGRIVTVASPHGGSCVGAVVSRVAAGRWILGKAVADLLADVVAEWALPPREIGVISGNLPIGLGRLFPALRPPHDGVLAVAETTLASATDHVVLPVSHTGMLLSVGVARQVCHFLRTGRFDH